MLVATLYLKKNTLFILSLGNKVCGINVQKEIGAAYKDEACGKDAPENMAGLCQ